MSDRMKIGALHLVSGVLVSGRSRVWRMVLTMGWWMGVFSKWNGSAPWEAGLSMSIRDEVWAYMSLEGMLCWCMTLVAMELYPISEPFSKTSVEEWRIGVVPAQTSLVAAVIFTPVWRMDAKGIGLRGRLDVVVWGEPEEALELECRSDGSMKKAHESLGTAIIISRPVGSPGLG